MFRTTYRTLSAVLAFIVPTLAGAVVQSTEEEYVDPVVYQVESKFPVVAYPDGYTLDDNYSWETRSPAFDPRHEYTQAEADAVTAEEVRLSGGRLTTDTDGTPLILIDQPTIPEATRDTAPPPVEVYEEDGQVPPPQFQQAPSPTLAPSTFTRRWYLSDGFGNNLFGASYFIDTYVKATDASGSTAKKVQAYVDGKVNATAFNKTKEVIRGRVDVAGQQGGTNSGTLKLYAMSQQIYSKSLSASFTVTPLNFSRTFFAVSKTFMVGPVPVTVKASLVGGVKMSLTGKISPTEARLSATPGGYVNVMASAGVNVYVVSFGVEGSLTLISVGTPATAELIWPVCSALTWKLGSSLSLNTLSGNLKLFVKVKFLWIFKKKWTVTIANWTGYTYNVPLFSKSGSFGMGICPGFAPATSAPLMSVAAM